MFNKFTSVFKVSAGIMLVLVVIGVSWPDGLESATTTIQGFISDKMGWYYLIVVTLFVLVCLVFLITPLGKIKLGKQGEKTRILQTYLDCYVI